MRCMNCNAELPADSITCPYCGAALGGKTGNETQNGVSGAYQAPAYDAQQPVQNGVSGAYQAPAYDAQQPAQNGVSGAYQAPAYNAQQPVQNGAWSGKKKTRGRFAGRILYYVIGFAVIALIAVGLNVFHQHASFLSKGETVNLDDRLAAGEDYLLKEFVHVDAAFVLDTFASEDNTINGISTGKDSYYVIVLQNFDAIAVKAASADHIAALDKATQDAMDFLDDKVDSVDDTPLEGKLVKMDDSELKGYFDEAMDAYGFTDSDSGVTPRYYVLDMTAARAGNVLLFIVVPAAAVILLAVGAVLFRKKRKAAKAEVSAE